MNPNPKIHKPEQVFFKILLLFWASWMSDLDLSFIGLFALAELCFGVSQKRAK